MDIIKNRCFQILMMFFIISIYIFGMNIKKIVKVRNDNIFLSDIIDIEDKETLEKAESILVTQSPEAGDDKEILQSYLRIKLRQLDLSRDDLEELNIPESIIVFREYQILSKDRIIDEMYQELYDIYKDSEFEYQIDYNGNEEFKLPVGNIEILLDVDRLPKDRVGEFTIATEIYVNEQRYERLINRIAIGKVIYTPILVRNVSQDEALTPDLVTLKREIQTRSYTHARDIDLDEYTGYIFRRDLTAGTELKTIHLKRNKLFRRNSNVDVVLQNGNITLKTVAKAREDGYEGETVIVENLQSGKTYSGLVLKNGTVYVSVR